MQLGNMPEHNDEVKRIGNYSIILNQLRSFVICSLSMFVAKVENFG